MYNRGGQQRTTQLPCGKIVKGHPNEVDGKITIHRRNCKSCIQVAAENDGFAELPDFCKTGAKMNGWNGLTAKGQKPMEMMTTACYDGFTEEFIVNANNIPTATRIVKDMINADAFGKDIREKHLLVDELLNYYKDCVEANIELRCWKNYTKADLQQMPLRKLQLIEELIHQEIENLVKDEYADDEDFAEFLAKGKENNIVFNVINI